ncbi:TetR/AcrR family transcriptional regulator [Saccharothrix violaceirubra]|uniref:AcrR family transcriptional regulator n=1 Tax=Saccharothrix violaceirubra TaxID=413306 RepID=A0A7W7T391_9PSEU|nr:TetR/AcrR family transcriptional regulator [Saccharothrix violaceirubra]MBB4965739.1 AcrR family transcriptional regulator [Saccharothrix violaceirubra]
MPRPADPVEPPWWTPRKQPTARRNLTREAIVTTALAVLREEGVDGLSMRRIAADLGTGPASLYAHVANKDELLELLVDEVMGGIEAPAVDPARWREQLTGLWVAAYQGLLANGDIARAIMARVPLGPNALRLSEAATALMVAGGVEPRTIAWSLDIISLYVVGSAVEDAVSTALARSGRDAGEYYQGIADYLAALPAERFPHLVALSAEHAQGDRDERFRFGLDLLVRGLTA